MQDMLGNEIVVGDMVVYPGRQSSSLWMNCGRVVECNEGELNPNPHSPHPYWKYLVQPTIKVARRCLTYPAGRPAELVSRTFRVASLQRLIVVPHSQFGDADREFFELSEA